MKFLRHSRRLTSHSHHRSTSFVDQPQLVAINFTFQNSKVCCRSKSRRPNFFRCEVLFLVYCEFLNHRTSFVLSVNISAEATLFPTVAVGNDQKEYEKKACGLARLFHDYFVSRNDDKKIFHAREGSENFPTFI